MARLKINGEFYDIGNITLTNYGVPFDAFIVKRTIADQSIKLPYSLAMPFGTMRNPQDIAIDAEIYMPGGDIYNVSASPITWSESAVTIALVQRYSAGVERALGANLTDWAESAVPEPTNTIVNSYPFVSISNLLRWLSNRTGAIISVDSAISDYYANTSVVANGELGEDGQQWDGNSPYIVKRNLPNVSVVDFLQMLCKAVGGYVEVMQTEIALRQRQSPDFADYSDLDARLKELGRGVLQAKSNVVRYSMGWTANQYVLTATRRDLPATKDFVIIDINALATSHRFKDLSTNKPYQGTLLVPRPDIRNNFVWSYFALMLEGWQSAKLTIRGINKIANYFSLGGDYYQTVSYTTSRNVCEVNAYRISGNKVANAEIIGHDAWDVIEIEQGDYVETIASKQKTNAYINDPTGAISSFDEVSKYWILHQYLLTLPSRKMPASFDAMTARSAQDVTVDLFNGSNMISYVRRGCNVATLTVSVTVYHSGSTSRVVSYNVISGSDTVVNSSMLSNWADEVDDVAMWVRYNPNAQQYPRTNGYPSWGTVYINDPNNNYMCTFSFSGTSTQRDQKGVYNYIPSDGTILANLLRFDVATNFEPTPSGETGNFPLSFTIKMFY